MPTDCRVSHDPVVERRVSVQMLMSFMFMPGALRLPRAAQPYSAGSTIPIAPAATVRVTMSPPLLVAPPPSGTPPTS